MNCIRTRHFYLLTETHDLEILTSDPLKYIMDNPIHIAPICMGESIMIQWVNNHLLELREKVDVRNAHTTAPTRNTLMTRRTLGDKRLPILHPENK